MRNKTRTNFTPLGYRIRKVPVTVQGLLIQPGEEVLVVVGDRVFRHTYTGQVGLTFWMDAPMTTAEGRGPGPYRLEDLRHPDILTGLAKHLTDGKE